MSFVSLDTASTTPFYDTWMDALGGGPALREKLPLMSLHLANFQRTKKTSNGENGAQKTSRPFYTEHEKTIFISTVPCKSGLNITETEYSGMSV